MPGVCEGAKEDKSGWAAFLRHLVDRGLEGAVKLIISDACRGLIESTGSSLPGALATLMMPLSPAMFSAMCLRPRFAKSATCSKPSCPGGAGERSRRRRAKAIVDEVQGREWAEAADLRDPAEALDRR